MSKAVMISIKPKWVELIASGRKTVEVRKTRPKIDVPFKCYIYETQGRKWQNKNEPQMQECRGRVIGEFVCDYITNEITVCMITDTEYLCLTVSSEHCRKSAYLTERELYEYSNGKTLYGWHISNLKMYDKPKELSKFCNGKSYLTIGENGKFIYTGMTRPPQSWEYVEELK